MARIRENLVNGFVDDDPLTSGALTLNSSGLADLPEVTGGDTAAITLDPENKQGGGKEIVYVTAHTASATSATISRSQEDTSAVEFPQGTKWVHTPTREDFDHGNLSGLGDDDHTIYSLADGTRTITGAQLFQRASASNAIVNGKVTGDSQNRVTVQADGKIIWGSGGASQDTNLYRSNANELKTDDNLVVAGGSIQLGADANLYRESANVLRTGDALTVDGVLTVWDKALAYNTPSTATSLAARVDGDSADRLAILSGGKLQWGDGTNPADTNLYRSTGDYLKTDDSLQVGGQVLSAYGTEAAPGIAFDGNADTGLRRSATDELTVVTDGADRWKADANGDLLPADDDTYDIGSAAARVATLFAGNVEGLQMEAATLPADTVVTDVWEQWGSTISHEASFTNPGRPVKVLGLLFAQNILNLHPDAIYAFCRVLISFDNGSSWSTYNYAKTTIAWTFQGSLVSLGLKSGTPTNTVRVRADIASSSAGTNDVQFNIGYILGVMIPD